MLDPNASNAKDAGAQLLEDVPLDADPAVVLENIRKRQDERDAQIRKLQSKSTDSQTDVAELGKVVQELTQLTDRYKTGREKLVNDATAISDAAEARGRASKLKDVEQKTIVDAVNKLVGEREANRNDVSVKQEAWQKAEIQYQQDVCAFDRVNAEFQRMKTDYDSLDPQISALSKAKEEVIRQQDAGEEKLAFLGAYLLRKNIETVKSLLEVKPEDLATKLQDKWKASEQAKRTKKTSRAATDDAKTALENAKKKVDDDWNNGLTTLKDDNTNKPKNPKAAPKRP